MEPTRYPGLSDREAEILTLVAAGLRTEEIARRLHLSAGSIWAYVARAKSKLGASTLPHAIRIALVRGLICTCEAEDRDKEARS